MRLTWFVLAFATGGLLALACDAFGQCPINETGPMLEDNNGRRLLYLECQSVAVVTKSGDTIKIFETDKNDGIEIYVVVTPMPDINLPAPADSTEEKK